MFTPKKKSRDSKWVSFDITLHLTKCEKNLESLKNSSSFNLAANGFIICRTLGMRPQRSWALDTHKIPPHLPTKFMLFKCKEKTSLFCFFEVPAKNLVFLQCFFQVSYRFCCLKPLINIKWDPKKTRRIVDIYIYIFLIYIYISICS